MAQYATHRRPDLQGSYQLIPGKVEVLCQHVGHMPPVLMLLIVRSLVRVALPHHLPEVTTRLLRFNSCNRACLCRHMGGQHNIQCCSHRNNCVSSSDLKHQTSEQTAGDSRKPASHKRLLTYRLFGHHASQVVCHNCPGPGECHTAHCLLLPHRRGTACTDHPSVGPA